MSKIQALRNAANAVAAQIGAKRFTSMSELVAHMHGVKTPAPKEPKTLILKIERRRHEDGSYGVWRLISTGGLPAQWECFDGALSKPQAAKKQERVARGRPVEHPVNRHSSPANRTTCNLFRKMLQKNSAHVPGMQVAHPFTRQCAAFKAKRGYGGKNVGRAFRSHMIAEVRS